MLLYQPLKVSLHVFYFIHVKFIIIIFISHKLPRVQSQDAINLVWNMDTENNVTAQTFVFDIPFEL